MPLAILEIWHLFPKISCFDYVVDLDECKEKLACQCPECQCKNTWGSYECSCTDGLFYTRENDMCIGEFLFLTFSYCLYAIFYAGLTGSADFVRSLKFDRWFFMENMTLHWLPHWHFISIHAVCSFWILFWAF